MPELECYQERMFVLNLTSINDFILELCLKYAQKILENEDHRPHQYIPRVDNNVKTSKRLATVNKIEPKFKTTLRQHAFLITVFSYCNNPKTLC